MLVNKDNGQKYIGQTTQGVNKRWAQHINEARRMSAYPIHKAIRKYGTHMFLVRELCECDANELDDKERDYIEKYDTFNKGYNATDGGGRLSEESIEKIREKAKQPKSEEHTANVSEALKDKYNKGDEWGFHLESNRGDGKHLRVRLLAVNVDTGEETIYESFTAASLALKGTTKYSGSISRACKEGYKCYNHRWKRLDSNSKCKPVYGVHRVTWERTQTYPSIRAAAKHYGCKDTGLRKSLNHPNKYTWKQHYWFSA